MDKARHKIWISLIVTILSASVGTGEFFVATPKNKRIRRKDQASSAPVKTGQKDKDKGHRGETRFNQGMPFGINNAFASSQAQTDVHLKDLGVEWISDHLARRNMEKIKKNETTYDF
ncbi:MAG TPA: hypothetical protein VJ521_15185, partial [Acidobacteriota bacterium]|nr:hypothetical protein [Acidobacteriota bacterium]